jgi:anti-sigma28 factor (negative regulator of flagellin synthesis)
MGKERGYSQWVDGLRSLLRVNATLSSAPQHRGKSFTAGARFDGDQATLSPAATKVSQTLLCEGVRLEKVAAIQLALVAGTYSVPAAAVASKLVAAMLTGGHQSCSASIQQVQVIKATSKQYTSAQSLEDCQNAASRDAETRDSQSESGT